jgi:GNAT superfamily N-acetyltransferase
MQRRWGSSLIGLLTGTQATISPIRPKTLPLDARIREYRSKDKTACVEIYNENEPGRFPAGFGGQFVQFLEHPGYLKLICSIDEEPVAVGGIGRIPGLFADHVWLVFGMVRPAHHGRGIGTAMLVARLGALPRPVAPVRVMLSNVAASEGFFARFGFAYQGQMVAPHSGILLDVKSGLLDLRGWETCRILMQESGVEPNSIPSVPTVNMYVTQPNSTRETKAP